MKLQAIKTTCIGTMYPCQYIIKFVNPVAQIQVPQYLYIRYRGGRFTAGVQSAPDDHIVFLVDEHRVSNIGGREVAPLFEMMHWLKVNGIEVIGG
jgi:hypothetical protein